MNDQLSDYIKKNLSAGYSVDQIRKECLDSGWPVEKVNLVIDKETTKKINKKLWIILIMGLVLLGAGVWQGVRLGKGYFKQANEQETEMVDKESKVENEMSVFEMSQQILTRVPTNNVVEEEVYTNLIGMINYQGKSEIIQGTAFQDSEYMRGEYQKVEERIAQNSLMDQAEYIIEARGIDGEVVAQVPVEMSEMIETNSQRVSEKEINAGSFFAMIKLPKGTNYVVLRENGGDILDQIYMDDWEPRVEISGLAGQYSTGDDLETNLELYPKGKAYELFLRIESLDGDESFILGGEAGTQVDEYAYRENLGSFPFVNSGNWKLVVAAQTFFQVKEFNSEPFEILVDSEAFKVEISGKDQLVRQAGSEDFVSWSHGFVYVSSEEGLKDLCKQGRCFELIWSGEGVLFNSHKQFFTDLKAIENTIKTDYVSLNCYFQGTGKQAIKLQVTENGNLVGEDVYEFELQGSSMNEGVRGSDANSSVCLVEDL